MQDIDLSLIVIQQENYPLLDPKKTTVLVPLHPDALDIFNEETMEEAEKERQGARQ